MSRSRLDELIAAATFGAMMTGCGPTIVPPGGGAEDGSGSGSASASSGDETAGVDDTGAPAPTIRSVDIIIMVDDSGSMNSRQETLVQSIGALLDALDGAEPPVDYRIAVTTTDNGNPWCVAEEPDAGRFEPTSCMERIEDFFPGWGPGQPVQVACREELCPFETLDLPVPWIDVERTTGITNVPQDDVLGVARCLLPMGVVGCGFEQPLESLHRAIERTETPGDPSFGFIRPGGLLAVLLLTDEIDCSYNPTHEAIFSVEGDRIFWSDPGSEWPTSAVCWNAGVECSGTSVYDECHAVDLNSSGAPVQGEPAQEAVLRPVSRYIEQLAGRGAYFSAIHGVGADGSPVYADSPADPDFQGDFGIGPGCEDSGGWAVPPVRVRQVIEAVSGPGALHSVCTDDYGPALASFAAGILERLP